MTDSRIVSTDAAPAAIGPYSQAHRVGNTVYCSGQIALDPATATMVGSDVAKQTERVMSNLRGVLEAAGSGLGDVVKTTVYLASMDDFAGMNEVYGRHFGSHRPARSTVEVSRLPKDALVEVDCIAVVRD